jgi:hypothetical protein
VLLIPLDEEAARPERGGSLPVGDAAAHRPIAPDETVTMMVDGVAAQVEVPRERMLAERLLAKPSHPVAGYCTCGGRDGDHIAFFGGYCILVKNARTAKIPGVLPLCQVTL